MFFALVRLLVALHRAQAQWEEHLYRMDDSESPLSKVRSAAQLFVAPNVASASRLAHAFFGLHVLCAPTRSSLGRGFDLLCPQVRLLSYNLNILARGVVCAGAGHDFPADRLAEVSLRSRPLMVDIDTNLSKGPSLVSFLPALFLLDTHPQRQLLR